MGDMGETARLEQRKGTRRCRGHALQVACTRPVCWHQGSSLALHRWCMLTGHRHGTPIKLACSSLLTGYRPQRGGDSAAPAAARGYVPHVQARCTALHSSHHGVSERLLVWAAVLVQRHVGCHLRGAVAQQVQHLVGWGSV